jgi:type II secretory pathway component PulF
MTHPAPPPTAKPASAPRRPVGVVVAFTLLIHALVPLGVLLMLIFVVPQVAESWKSMEVELPTVSVAVLALSQWTRRYFVIVAPAALIGLMAAEGFLVAWIWRHRRRFILAIAWWGVVAVVEGAMVLAMILAIYLPIIRLQESLGR